MAKLKEFSGLYRRGVYRCWRIKFPYMSERYVFFGPKKGAVAEAKRIQKKAGYPYEPSIVEVNSL